MCLGIPMRLVAVTGHDGTVAVGGGVSRRVRLDLVPAAEIGEFVIVHAGFAIEVLDEAAALETLDLLDQLMTEAPEQNNEPAAGR
ncbi:MAG: HypC/HybG/HupF family hydrogenase formation chaperone [Pseudomonadota bacterium]